MLDLKYVKENLGEVKKALAKKHAKFDLERLLELDEARRKLITKVDELRAKKKTVQKATATAKKEKLERKEAEAKLEVAQKEFTKLASSLHNLPHESVPTIEQGDQVIKEWGKKPKFRFEPKDFGSLGESLDIIDTERAAKISGARFGYLKNQAVFLQLALMNWLMESLTQQGFIPMITPVLVHERAMFGTGFFPAEEFEYYKIEGEDLYLTGSCEVALAGYHTDEKIPVTDLPKKYVGYSTNFRKEAGTYGKDTKGIFRVHQFDKVEMFVFARPEDSWEEYGKLQEILEDIYQQLKLPYRLVNMSGGNIGMPNAKKIDLEAWFPAQNQYRELASLSHDTDFQARRLGIRFEGTGGSSGFLHTMNCTASAIGRTILAILENYQTEAGAIRIPKILQKYLEMREIK